jgi:hypothetical protein
MDNKREERKEAAAHAAQLFVKKKANHVSRFGADISMFQLADMAMESRQEAEKQYETKISVTFDVEDNCYFQ